jgi:hypothetical protein
MTDSPLKKLLVRNVVSKKFLKCSGRWTKREDAAFNFPTLVDAIHTCLTRGLKEVEFIVRFERDIEDHCYCLSLA